MGDAGVFFSPRLLKKSWLQAVAGRDSVDRSVG
jgi:hypothetical protein